VGFSHYWYREREIDPIIFNKIVADFKKLLPLFKVLDIPLADGFGENEPEINENTVWFNGRRNCGHQKNKHIGLAWPSKNVKFGTAPSSEGTICDNWFAGVVLNQRTCDGDCSYETFNFPRILSEKYAHKIGKINYRKVDGTIAYNEPELVGKYFDCCKTNFKPYDLAVQVFLVIAKHYLKDKIIISSDGEIQHWIDATKICQNAFNYGMDDFKLE